jgi:hypothetical protein
MNRKIFLTLIIAAAIFASCNSSSTGNSSKQTLVVATADATIKYQCPMKCEGDTAYTTTGKCPVCEMDLEKVTQ